MSLRFGFDELNFPRRVRLFEGCPRPFVGNFKRVFVGSCFHEGFIVIGLASLYSILA